MTIKSALSIAALVAGLGLTGSAYAQTMVGAQTVSEADSAAVMARCTELQTASADAVEVETTSTSTEDAEDDEDTNTAGETTPTFEDESAGEAETTEPADAAVAAIDLEAITLEECIADGWVVATE